MRAALRPVAAVSLAIMIAAAGARFMHSADRPGLAPPAMATAAPAANIPDEPEQVVESRRRTIAATVIALALFGWLTRRWP